MKVTDKEEPAKKRETKADCKTKVKKVKVSKENPETKEPKDKTDLKGLKVMLAQTYDPEKVPEPENWMMSEKLDGVRCYWNGKAMYSRNGKKFFPPKEFI